MLRFLFSKLLYRLFIQLLTPETLPKNGDTGVVLLLCHSHVHMACFALKSFFVQLDTNLPATVIDDGSLDTQDIRFLKKKFKHIHIISAVKANRQIKTLLKPYPYCLAHRTGSIVNQFNKKLFDPILLTSYKQIILMDSDVIFFNPPSRVLKWIDQASSVSLYAQHYAHKDYHRTDVDPAWLIILRMYIERINPKIDFNFNSGFICLHRISYKLDRIEKLMQYMKNVGLDKTWAPEQFIFSTLVAESKHETLGESYVHTHSAKEFKKLITNPFACTMIHYAYYAKDYFFPEAIKMIISNGDRFLSFYAK